MRGTNYDYFNFLNALTPAIIRLEASPKSSAGGSYFIINIPAAYIVERDLAKELIDRLRDLRTRYSLPLFLGSKPPSEKAYEDAKAFILSLPLNTIVQPTIHVASDGEVNFEWSHGGAKIDLGFYGDGTFSFYGAKEGQGRIFGDAVPVRNGIPQELLRIASAT